MSKLAERAARFPESWRPAQGDVLEGVVTELDERDSEYGPPYAIVTVETDDGGELAAHCFHTMLRNAIARQNPQVGDRIAIAYHGLGEAQPGMSAPHRYRVIVERGEQPLSTQETNEGLSEAQPQLAEATANDDDVPF